MHNVVTLPSVHLTNDWTGQAIYTSQPVLVSGAAGRQPLLIFENPSEDHKPRCAVQVHITQIYWGVTPAGRKYIVDK